ncbi:MAG: bifunctional UDP-N-acetylglucosamine diphosphorylase/glucosamine-1-phosphate N-acetyltransferase GlmU [Holosporales bacterium]|jgi:bifunctional UDP-N-acetylglucosamine pyrophosphorylase/glucosamine-1-phosphate N-acetyltransferase|nr:bifunctional UDP-N-acetylglucosamine diphosphorylase/glucosamine-1-phosphate N-acetyltransferase GlmU [Holosporales bacterium]
MVTDVVILAAGRGTRMRSSIPKVLHEVAGLPIIDHVARVVTNAIDPINLIVVGSEAIEHHEIDGGSVVIQDPPDGTAGAVKLALPHVTSDNVVIVCGDLPLLEEQHLAALLESDADATFIATTLPPHLLHMPYGRVIIDGERFVKIVEFRDANDLEKQCHIINTGIYKFKTEVLGRFIHQIEKSESTGEYYLTDVLGMIRLAGLSVSVITADAYQPFHGANTMGDLAAAEEIMQNRLRDKFMTLGTKLLDPKSTFMSYDTVIASDVTIEQNVVIGKNVRIGDGAVIKAFSYIEDCEIGECVSVGPFARIRGSSTLEHNSSVGNFIEVKGSTIGAGSKAKHLSYIGDSAIGHNVNIGAGTVICNYDGVRKHRTSIGNDAFIGSNTTLIAPLTIGSRSIVAAGSTIVDDVPDDSLAISRPSQKVIIDGARRVWERKGKKHSGRT